MRLTITRNARIGVGIAFAAILISAGIQFMSHSGENSPPEQVRAAPTIDDTSQIRTVEIRLSDGGAANVFREGEQVGTTPFRLSGRFGEKIDLTLRRPGFRDKQQTIQISERGLYSVPMEREQ
jgi:hypothetical protein